MVVGSVLADETDDKRERIRAGAALLDSVNAEVAIGPSSRGLALASERSRERGGHRRPRLLGVLESCLCESLTGLELASGDSFSHGLRQRT